MKQGYFCSVSLLTQTISTMSQSNTIGHKIAEARRKMSISQAQLGERLFISQQAIGKWERSESLPDIVTLNRLAEILGVDLNYFSESQHAPATGSSDSGLLDKKTAEPGSTRVISQVPEPPVIKSVKRIKRDMSDGNWADADFSGLKDLHGKFSSSNMQRCRFIGSELSGLLLKSNNIDSCNFSGSDLSNCRIHGSNLMKNIFEGCSLKETEFSGSNIDSCDFSGSDCTGTAFLKSHLYGCNFKGADFTGAVIKSGGFSGVAGKHDDPDKSLTVDTVWSSTSFIDTHIADITFSGTMKNCSFENCNFTRVTIVSATLINTFFKNNTRMNRIRFIDCKADRITLEFLKQGKADLNGITLFTPEVKDEF